MYDWNALWHLHQDYRTAYGLADRDINQLADALGGKLLKSARDSHDLAVYDTGSSYTLLRHDDGLQLLTLEKQQLFDIAIRLVTADEGQALALPYLEVLVDNLASAWGARKYGGSRAAMWGALIGGFLDDDVRVGPGEPERADPRDAGPAVAVPGGGLPHDLQRQRFQEATERLLEFANL